MPDREELLKLIHKLMYLQDGYGYGMSYSEIMSLDVPDLYRFVEMLDEQRERDAQAVKKAADGGS